MPIYMTARFRVRRGSVEKCREAICEFVEYIRAHEPRTQVYFSLQEISDPTRIMNILIFENEAALLLHRNSPGAQKFTSVIYPECVESVEFTEYNVIANRNE